MPSRSVFVVDWALNLPCIVLLLLYCKRKSRGDLETRASIYFLFAVIIRMHSPDVASE